MSISVEVSLISGRTATVVPSIYSDHNYNFVLKYHDILSKHVIKMHLQLQFRVGFRLQIRRVTTPNESRERS